ncbi:MAG TPA: DNA-formamidopyrimidine glycosylase family protein [Mucilaginibacter sp.]|nr:DNA-formamidopyrimidine glycosylase family protein [Mucilaginibacter sp.]
MPEGPSIIILKEKLKPFKGRKITAAKGYAKNIDPDMFTGSTLTAVKSYGKQLILSFKGISIRVHLGLFGSYQINSHGKRNASLHLQFGEDEVNFYIVNIKVIEGPVNKAYNWSADIMSPKWDEKKAIEKLKAKPERMICDALLDQDIFAGSGNIIKNETLFRARIQPESLCGKIPAEKLKDLLSEVVKFSSDFLKWKKKGILNKHLQAYEQATCPRNHVPFHKKDTGKSKRHSYYCTLCQELYD